MKNRYYDKHQEYLKDQLREAKENYLFHKSRSEWDEATKWASIHSDINNLIEYSTKKELKENLINA
jgi:hypothetical protein